MSGYLNYLSNRERTKKRLQRDLKEWMATCHEIPNVRALPLDNNIYEWHVNIRPQSGVLQGIYFHLIVKFPYDYPNNPPDIRVCHHINHPNVFTDWICLDMIKSYTKSTPYQGWTMAYSAFSIFFQLQSFLLGGKILQDYGGIRDTKSYFRSGYSRMKQESKTFVCKNCPHKPSKPWPEVPLLGDKSGMTQRQLRKQKKYAKRDRKNQKKGKDYFEMLYDDVERHIQKFLGLRDLFNASKINVHWSEMIKSLNILQINKFGCWYKRIDLYTAETNNIELVLGYGIKPKLFENGNPGPYGFRLMNTCATTFDLVSHDAYSKCNVRTTVWKDMTFTDWIPMYITKKHGNNIWKYLDETVKKIWGNDDHKERKILHLIAITMNTLVVGIMNCTTESKTLNLRESINVLDAYFHYHHLLLAVYSHYNDILKPYVQALCGDFIKNPEKRNKKNVPNLGELMIYFTLTKYSWDDICYCLLSEGFVRNVKWTLMVNPELIYLEDYDINCYRLNKTFTASRVSKKLYMFQSFFMRRCLDLGNVRWMQKFKEYNDNFGGPPEQLPGLLQDECKNIHKICKWKQFFKKIELPPINNEQLTKWLRNSVVVSDERGYHRNTEWNLIKSNKKRIKTGLGWISGNLPRIKKERRQCICYQKWDGCEFVKDKTNKNKLYGEYKVERNALDWWTPKMTNIQCFDKKTCRWFNATITEITGGFMFKVSYPGWEDMYGNTISMFGDRIVKGNTYKIINNKRGYFDKSRLPSNVSLKTVKEEYERKTRIVKIVSRRENTKKSDAVNKAFFKHAASNSITNMQHLLNLPTKPWDFIHIQHAIRAQESRDKLIAKNGKKPNKKKNKPLKGKQDLIDKVKAWKCPINVGNTDVNNRTPLFICCFKGHFDMIKLLLNVGVDVNVVDIYGETALDAAKKGEIANPGFSTKYTNIKKLLERVMDKAVVAKRKSIIDKEIKARELKQKINNENKSESNDESKNDDSKQEGTNEDKSKKDKNVIKPRIYGNGNVYRTRTVFIGNISNVKQEELDSLLGIYDLKYDRCTIKKNFAIVKFKKSHKELSTKINKINGSFFRGATVSASIFENNVRKDAVTTGEDAIKPNKVLFIRNFDILKETQRRLFKILASFGPIKGNRISINVDKFGEPFCICEYVSINSAIKAYQHNYTAPNPINIGNDNDLEIQYSRKFNNNSNRNEGQRNKTYNNNNNNNNRSIYSNNKNRTKQKDSMTRKGGIRIALKG